MNSVLRNIISNLGKTTDIEEEDDEIISDTTLESSNDSSDDDNCNQRTKDHSTCSLPQRTSSGKIKILKPIKEEHECKNKSNSEQYKLVFI